jgi:Chaperone of endosialidase
MNASNRIPGTVMRCPRRSVVGFWIVVGAATMSVPASAAPSGALLTIDQNRAAVVDGIVADRGFALTQSAAGLTSDELRSMLMQLRADQLLAASMAGTPDGVRDVIARSLVGSDPVNPALLQTESVSTGSAGLTKAIGDNGDDVVYTPVTPCRLVETRGSFAAVYQGNGPSHTAFPFNVNEIRTYFVQGGNSVCLSQLPSGLGAAAVQLQVFGMPTAGGSGDLEILPQGTTFGKTATEVFIGSIAFNTVSTTVKINPANNQISVQVRGGKANVAMDVVGYFRTPGNYTADFVSGVGAAVGGGADNSASGEFSTVGGGEVNKATGTAATVGGGFGNEASGVDSIVSGGSINQATGLYSSVLGGQFNTASGQSAVVLGGESNAASGNRSVAAGFHAMADQNNCAVFDLWGTSDKEMTCLGLPSVFRVGAVAGLSVDYYSELDHGFGTKWVALGNFFPNQTISTWTAAFLTDGGVWTNNSDRDSKTDFSQVDSRAILAKVESLPITTWRYKNEQGQLHLGPMAQDFHAAFGLGPDERHIGTIDESGVALAAIQALAKENAELRRRLEAVERRDAVSKASSQ